MKANTNTYISKKTREDFAEFDSLKEPAKAFLMVTSRITGSYKLPKEIAHKVLDDYVAVASETITLEEGSTLDLLSMNNSLRFKTGEDKYKIKYNKEANGYILQANNRVISPSCAYAFVKAHMKHAVPSKEFSTFMSFVKRLKGF